MVAGRNDLVVGVELETRGVERGAARVGDKLDHMGRNARSFGNTASKGFGKANRGLLELSRGAEDFAVSFGTGGIAGGFRGAANNISQFASMMHPLAGAMAGLGVAAISMWLGFNKGADQAIKKTGELESIAKKLRDGYREAGQANDFRQNLLAARGGFGAADGPFEGRRITADDIGMQRRKHELDASSLEELRGKRNLAQQKVDGLELAFRSAGIALPKEGEDIADDAPHAVDQRRLQRERQRAKTLGSLVEDARKREQESFSRLRIAEETRNRAGLVGEGAGINQQRREFSSSLEARRQAARDRKKEFQAEQRERSLGRQGGHLNVMGPMSSQSPQTSTPAGLASIATKGSAGAARAVAEAKNQSNIQKAQLDEQKKQTDLLQNISQSGQADVVIESFGSVA